MNILSAEDARWHLYRDALHLFHVTWSSSCLRTQVKPVFINRWQWYHYQKGELAWLWGSSKPLSEIPKTSGFPPILNYTAIFLQTSRYRHVSVTVWETRHIKTIRPVQNRGLTWYRRSHMGTLAFNSHCTWTRQCSHRTVQFPQRHVRC